MGVNLRKILPFLLLAFTSIIFYITILNGFFQQDEWVTFGAYIIRQHLSVVAILKYLFAFDIGHYDPFTNIVQFSLFNFWGINYTNFALFGIILHVANVLFVYILSRRVFKNNIYFSIFPPFFFFFFSSIFLAFIFVVVYTY